MSAARPDAFPFFRLLVLTGAIFVSISSEFLPTGLLPDIAADLNASESRVGLLVTIFAGTVVISTAPLTILTRRLPRKQVMITVLLVFVVANILAGLAPTYEFLVFARILGGLAHGLFWAVTGPYTTHLVKPGQLVRALSITNAGGTAAFIIGIPFGTAIGHALGWRVAFFVMAALVLGFAALVLFYLPPVDHTVALTTGELALPYHRDRTIPAVIAACILCIIIMLGHNAFATYVVIWDIDGAGFSPDAASGLLFATGIAGAFGLAIAGFAGDRYPRVGFWLLLAGVAASMFILWTNPEPQWLVVSVLVLWGVSFGGLPSLLHGRVLRAASPRVRDLSSAALTTSFNLAIGGGAFIGGLLLDGFGVGILPFANFALVIVGLAAMIIIDLRRHPHHPHQSRQGTSGAR